MTVSIKVTGLAKLAVRLNAKSGLIAGIKAAIMVAKGAIAVYPPATEANKPGRTDAKGKPLGYYVRGTGWYSPSGRVYANSETLGRKWTTSTKNGGYTGIVGNSASYAPYVQDRDKQAWFHGLRGWKTVQDWAENSEFVAKLKAIIKDSIVSWINRKQA